MSSRSTASIIIIGDEILNGQTQDTNSHFLCRELYKCGIKVERISVIPDDINIIADEVSLHSEKYSFVITSGGIGPTHDDVTYQGIAKAFNEKLLLNKDLKNIWKQLCTNLGLDEAAAFKMSCVPQSANIHNTGKYKETTFIPIISVRNVFIFPGIPSYLEHAFSSLKPMFSTSSVQYYHHNLYLTISEFSISDILEKTVKEFDGKVKLGSYPEIEKCYKVKISIEADSKETVEEAEAFLRSHLPHNCIVGQFPPNSSESYNLLKEICDKMSESCDEKLSEDIFLSSIILQRCLNKYSLDGVCLSFNGGKDCTVLLHITNFVILNTYQVNCPRLKVLYVRSKQAFPEIEDFIQLCVKRYNLNLITYDQPIKNALYNLQRDHPEIKAILMGSRHTDPHCSMLKSFQMTDSDWPQFMRVSPLIHWTYPQVWKFLRSLKVPYCSLYDRGYTSLGCQHNTLPNDKLLAMTKHGDSYYRPAYLLEAPEQEREGREMSNV